MGVARVLMDSRERRGELDLIQDFADPQFIFGNGRWQMGFLVLLQRNLSFVFTTSFKQPYIKGVTRALGAFGNIF